MKKLKKKKIFILGMARSGYNVAKLLAKNNEILITDLKDQDTGQVNELKNLGVTFIKTDHPEKLCNGFDIIIRNPGISPNHPVVMWAKENNIPVTTEVEIAYHYLPKKCKIIGITGSNGKTTTTTMLYDMLKLMDKNVLLGGNIGIPLSEIALKASKNSILVLEISDHQLYDTIDFKTNISVLTNLCPTHLDFHGNYENYINVKKKIFNRHNKKNLAIINKDNNDCLKITDNILSNKVYFNDDNNYFDDRFIYINQKPIIALDDIKLKGKHNYENILAALLVVNEFGIDEKIIKNYLSNFKGVEHRIEYVCEKDKVKYYNDSKSTNPTATITALNSFNNPIHLILGGMERKQDFNELNDAIKNVKIIYAVGEVTDRIAEYAKKQKIKCIKCHTLEKAVDEIKKNVEANDIVLLSPASASWDQFAKFEDRGDLFKSLVK